MTFKTWVIAGAAVAFAAIAPQESQAKFGPSASLATADAETGQVRTVSDDFSRNQYLPYGGYTQVHYRGRRGYRGGYHRPARRHYRHRHRGYGGGFFGSVVVGVPFIGGGYYGPVYQPRYRHRPVRRYRSGYLEPWTPEWFRYCSSRYRTFNPRTGYYFYKVGRQRFCR